MSNENTQKASDVVNELNEVYQNKPERKTRVKRETEGET